MKKSEIYEEILGYMCTNNDEGNAVVEELDSWNGYLGDDRIYSVDLIDDVLYNKKPSEILDMVGEWNSSDDYFFFSPAGYLVSTSYIDYSLYFDEYLIEEVVNDWHNLYTDNFAPKLIELFELLVNRDYEEDEED